MSAAADDVLGQIAKGGFYVPTAADSGLSGVVVGDVELVRLMASGATANVWEGRHRTAGVPVAVKIACRSGDAALSARFAHEAEMLEKVLPSDGPFPVFYGHGEHEGRPYLVMELLEPFDVPGESNAFGNFFLEALDAVEVLHQRGYIHQDLKPTNMMRRQSDGRLVLIDFGQAHKIEEGRLPLRMDSLTLDSSGRRMATGTAGYCAPEQLDAERTAFLPATDVYALGMMIRNFCGRRSEWRIIGSDATDPDLRRRIPDVEALRRQVRSKAFRNRRNATWDILHDIEARRSRRMGEMHVSWERLVSITLSQRRRTVGVRRLSEEPVLTIEELGGRLPGLGIGAREFGPVRIGLLTGLRCTIDERLHFTDSVVVRVYGSGVLDMDVSAEGEVVFVISGDCTVINRSTRQTGIDYFVNNGALLCFPQIQETDSSELRRHVHLASFDGAFVHYGAETSRDEINERYRREWDAAFAVGDSETLSILKDTRFARPDDGVPVVLRR